MSKKLTPKQSLFIKEYLIDLNATQAAIRAWYSTKTAYSIWQENLNKPEIKEIIDKSKKDREEKLDFDWMRVLRTAKELVDRCMQKVPVMEYDHDEKMMIPTWQWKFDSTWANSALDKLWKHFKLFSDTVRHEIEFMDSLHDESNVNDE
jgi:phage terminase small subunit